MMHATHLSSYGSMASGTRSHAFLRYSSLLMYLHNQTCLKIWRPITCIHHETTLFGTSLLICRLGLARRFLSLRVRIECNWHMARISNTDERGVPRMSSVPSSQVLISFVTF